MLTLFGATPTAALTAVFVTKSLSARLPEFIYDPDNGGRFDVWCNCYEDIIAKDGSTLADVARARLVVSKLDAATFARFTIHILPKKTSDVSLDETVKTLKELFGHNTSVFACRYVYLLPWHSATMKRFATTRTGQSLHEMAEFNDVTLEEMKCLVWICGLTNPEDTDIRTRALHKMEDNPQATLLS
ncbi:hypothetical protein ANCCAN_14866 [Ancylostoma caninum]|uniref:DUF7083 domain-containing protein n=1 Tax=Ancylostoma caninum TaxID=29170 RepID=A0A368G8A9_ANCCA|nr:hypothetical protein ANCCAN_14866 [Ancylostoma caninum]